MYNLAQASIKLNKKHQRHDESISNYVIKLRNLGFVLDIRNKMRIIKLLGLLEVNDIQDKKK